MVRLKEENQGFTLTCASNLVMCHVFQRLPAACLLL